MMMVYVYEYSTRIIIIIVVVVVMFHTRSRAVAEGVGGDIQYIYIERERERRIDRLRKLFVITFFFSPNLYIRTGIQTIVIVERVRPGVRSYSILSYHTCRRADVHAHLLLSFHPLPKLSSLASQGYEY